MNDHTHLIIWAFLLFHTCTHDNLRPLDSSVKQLQTDVARLNGQLKGHIEAEKERKP